MNTMIPYLLRTADASGNLMPSFVGTPASEEAKSLGWVEDYELTLGGVTGRYQRLTASGLDEKARRFSVA